MTVSKPSNKMNYHSLCIIIIGPIVGFDPVSYTVNEETMSGNLEICIRLFSVGDHPNPIVVQMSTVENTAMGELILLQYLYTSQT